MAQLPKNIFHDFDLMSEFERRRAFLSGSSAVASQRQWCVDNFRGLPNTHMEGWQKSDLKRLQSEHIAPTLEIQPRSCQPVTPWPFIKTAAEGVDTWQLPAGVYVHGLADFVKKDSMDAKSVFCPALKENSFDQLNCAFANDGFVLQVERNKTVNGLEAIIAMTAADRRARYFRNFVHVGAGAQAVLLLRSFSAADDGWLNSVTKITLDPDAHLTLYADFDSSTALMLSSLVHATVARGAVFSYCPLVVNVPSLRHEVHVSLEEAGAQFNLSACFLAAANEVVDVVTHVTHLVGKTASDQFLKTVSGRRGRTNFQGHVLVEKKAVKAKAKQECHGLLLDRGSETNIKPELLIYADDVACAHGATVGEVDKDALFYLVQRGIPETEARAILTHAFLSSVLDKITHEPIRDNFRLKTEHWMQQHSHQDESQGQNDASDSL